MQMLLNDLGLTVAGYLRDCLAVTFHEKGCRITTSAEFHRNIKIFIHINSEMRYMTSFFSVPLISLSFNASRSIALQYSQYLLKK
jgi:hypothetical protein